MRIPDLKPARARRRVATSIAAVALGLGLTLSAVAAPRHGAAEDGMFHGLQKLHDGLKLTPEQEAQWQKAQAQMKQNAEAARARHEAMRRDMHAALDQPDVDFRALSEQMDKSRDQDIAARRAAREQWLAFYDSLDAGQKEQVRGFMKERLQRFDKFRDKMREHREHRGEGKR